MPDGRRVADVVPALRGGRLRHRAVDRRRRRLGDGLMARIGVASILQETNTFSPLRCTLADFEAQGILRGPRSCAIDSRGTNTEAAGALEALDDAGVDAVPLLRAWAMSSGRVTAEALEALCGSTSRAARGAGALDGLVLSLHGAMAARAPTRRPRAASCRAGRIGPTCRSACASTCTRTSRPRFVADAGFVVGYRTYPHVDMASTGARDGAAPARPASRDDSRPVTALARQADADAAGGAGPRTARSGRSARRRTRWSKRGARRLAVPGSALAGRRRSRLRGRRHHRRRPRARRGGRGGARDGAWERETRLRRRPLAAGGGDGRARRAASPPGAPLGVGRLADGRSHRRQPRDGRRALERHGDGLRALNDARRRARRRRLSCMPARVRLSASAWAVRSTRASTSRCRSRGASSRSGEGPFPLKGPSSRARSTRWERGRSSSREALGAPHRASCADLRPGVLPACRSRAGAGRRRRRSLGHPLPRRVGRALLRSPHSRSTRGKHAAARYARARARTAAPVPARRLTMTRRHRARIASAPTPCRLLRGRAGDRPLPRRDERDRPGGLGRIPDVVPAVPPPRGRSTVDRRLPSRRRHAPDRSRRRRPGGMARPRRSPNAASRVCWSSSSTPASGCRSTRIRRARGRAAASRLAVRQDRGLDRHRRGARGGDLARVRTRRDGRGAAAPGSTRATPMRCSPP